MKIRTNLIFLKTCRVLNAPKRGLFSVSNSEDIERNKNAQALSIFTTSNMRINVLTTRLFGLICGKTPYSVN